MDFDLPDADNDALRVLDAELAQEIRAARTVTTADMPLAAAQAVHGLLRSAAVAPPPGDDGMIRIVDIEGLDRQACGGTHVRNTAEIVGVHITKVENKGRRNRRVRLQLETL
jgi:misacylated tRNA(Ala) deacylase